MDQKTYERQRAQELINAGVLQRSRFDMDTLMAAHDVFADYVPGVRTRITLIEIAEGWANRLNVQPYLVAELMTTMKRLKLK